MSILRTTLGQSWRHHPATHPRRRARDRALARPSLERLEVRWLPTASPLVVEPNETIDQAEDLGTLDQPAEVVGSIGGGPAGAADVTWFHFKLVDASQVVLDISTPAGDPPFASVLSLYNNDPQDYNDPYDPDGHRLLAQVQAHAADGATSYAQDLGPGDYFVAISGAGNLDFSPVIAGSGYDGATGTYELTIAATDLGLSGSGPTVLSSDPAAGAVLDSSPLAIRLDLSGPLDPDTILAGQNVQLLSGSGGPIALASVNFSATADELQLFPAGPLEPGGYVIELSGDSSGGQPVLTDPDGVPLGADAARPSGADESISFSVDGIDGVAGATVSDDTAASARDLGDAVGAGLIQVTGAIGDDPFFSPNLSSAPVAPEPQFDPANQVDLYQFQIDGPGRYAVMAEVFAGRIGSPLDPGISLYELDPSDGMLVFLAGNDNTLNPTEGTDGSIPLFTDSALTDGLTAGDYYLAVADGSNTPSPLEGQMPGSLGIFDPDQPGSAQLGWSTGPYVLNLLVEPTPNPPRVLASSPSIGQVLDQTPTQITVQFSEPMDVQELAYQAFETSYQSTLPQVFVEAADGTRYYPRFLAYDRATNQATFQMLDALPNGSYALHLSGPGGLTDLGGNPIAGDDLSGDYVIPFSVEGPDSGISGNMTDGYTVASTAGQGIPQDLGVLFPDELEAGVTVIRGPQSGTGPAASAAEDQYVIQLLQNQNYSFTLSGDDLPAGAQVTLVNASGESIPLLVSYGGQVYFGPLVAGTYTVAVGGWTAGQSAGISYQLTIDLVGQQDNAPPLVDGPAPALQIQLDGVANAAGTVFTAGADSRSAVGAADGTLSLFVSAPHESPLIHSSYLGGLAFLGIHPLGGVDGDAGPVPETPIQVALVRSGTSGGRKLLAKLVTLTSMISTNREGEGTEPAANLLEQPASDTIDESGSGSSVEVDSPAAPERGLAASERGERVGPPAAIGPPEQAALASNDPVPPGRETRPSSAGAVEDRIEAEAGPAAGIGAMRLVITGVIVSCAFWGRRAIRDLKWRKRTWAEQPKSAGFIGRRPSWGRGTFSSPSSGKGCASPHGINSPMQIDGSSRSRVAR